jgi:hypothetical protein
MRLDRIAVDLAKTYFFGSGLSADLPGGVMAFLKSPLASLGRCTRPAHAPRHQHVRVALAALGCA